MYERTKYLKKRTKKSQTLQDRIGGRFPLDEEKRRYVTNLQSRKDSERRSVLITVSKPRERK